jgi:bifunctional aspartokinase / homoserine dehydrogenase 1
VLLLACLLHLLFVFCFALLYFVLLFVLFIIIRNTAYFGAKVIHPKTMQPAISCQPRQIPIYIRNTFHATLPGTCIYNTSATTNHIVDTGGGARGGGGVGDVVCGFSSIENMALVNVEGSGMVGATGVAKRLFGTLEDIGINVVLISQASSEHSVTFATTMDQAEKAKLAILEEFAREVKQSRIECVDVIAPCSIIAAVGDGMCHTTGVSGRFFSALGNAKINVLAVAQGSSERNISAVVPEADSSRALRAVHAAFRLSHTSIRVAIIGMNSLGISLLKLLQSQRDALRATFDVDFQVCAVLPKTTSTHVVTLQRDVDGGSESITFGAYKSAMSAVMNVIPEMEERSNSWYDDSDDDDDDASKQNAETTTTAAAATTMTMYNAVSSPGGLSSILDHVFRNECTNHVIFDCTNDEEAGKCHAGWLLEGVDIATANNTGLSGPIEERRKLLNAEKALSKQGQQSAKYLREVTVGGGLPIVSTIRSLLHSGDRIRRIDGILSVSLSYIMFRISPPAEFQKCSDFDKTASHGVFAGDWMSMGQHRRRMANNPTAFMLERNVDTPCSFSTAVKEAINLGLMEEDPTKDLNNEYTARVLLVLAQELGMASTLQVLDIQKASDNIVENLLDESTATGTTATAAGTAPSNKTTTLDYQNLPPHIDEQVKQRVDAARSRNCVLRHVASIDVKSGDIRTELVEVPDHHVFAVNPPSCECVRLFTHRHESYPLCVQGPSAGADSTASALLAEVLQLMQAKASPRSVALSKGASSAALHSLASANNLNVL